MAMLASIMSGNIRLMGLIRRASPAPSTISATMPSMAATMTSGIMRRTSGTGWARAASGTASASILPCGSGGAGSR